MSEGPGEPKKDGWGAALRSLVNPVLTLTALGVITGTVLIFWADFRPLAAARDAILNEHMTEQAYERPPPGIPGAVRLIAFDDTSCGNGSRSDVECQPEGLVDRAKVAEIVTIAGKAKPAAIVIDIIPRALRNGCDSPTRALVDAIRDVSIHTPIILPRFLLRPLIGDQNVWAEGQTFLDQCPLEPEVRERFERGEGVFFGHAVLSSSEAGGAIDALPPSVTVDIVGSAGSPYRRRVPAISLIASLLMQGNDPKELAASFQKSGLETRWHSGTSQSADQSALRYCDVEGKNCLLDAAGLASFVHSWRINFRFGWDPSVLDEEKFKKLTPIPAGYFNDDWVERLKSESPATSVVLIAVTRSTLGDISFTPIGQLPGGVVHANALFAFADDGFLRPLPHADAIVQDLIHLALLIAKVIVVTLVLAAIIVVAGSRRKKPFRPRSVVHFTWPIALAGVAAYEMMENWHAIHEDFDQGILSLSLVGVILAAFEFRSAFEDGARILVPKLGGGLSMLRSVFASRSSPEAAKTE